MARMNCSRNINNTPLIGSFPRQRPGSWKRAETQTGSRQTKTALGPLNMVHDSASVGRCSSACGNWHPLSQDGNGNGSLVKNVSVKHDQSRVGTVIVEFTLMLDFLVTGCWDEWATSWKCREILNGNVETLQGVLRRRSGVEVVHEFYFKRIWASLSWRPYLNVPWSILFLRDFWSLMALQQTEEWPAYTYEKVLTYKYFATPWSSLFCDVSVMVS